MEKEGGAWLEPERIGLMGGSFNPIHLAHIYVAREAAREAAIGRVLFLPTGNPPHKRENLAPAGHRLMMVRLALAREADLVPSDIEMHRDGTVYTVDTLALLRERMPRAEFCYIVGEDTLYDLLNWREPDRVFQLCRFLVFRRLGSRPEEAAQMLAELKSRGAKFEFLSAQPRELSSTWIRARLGAGREPEGLDPAVAEYIRVMGLYGVAPSPPGFDAHMERLASSMSIGRLSHTLCVAYAARRLAAIHGEDAQAAALAGLLHDCAKGMDLKSMQAYAAERQMRVEPSILSSGSLLHAAVGAELARGTYGVRDERVLRAIAGHTLGNVPMTRLDMILYLADKIEPDRENYPGLEEIRELSQKDLRGAVLLSLARTAEYVRERGKSLHPATERTMAWLRESRENQIAEDAKEGNA